jgi:hypothetical protein
VAACCEHGDELSICIKRGQLFISWNLPSHHEGPRLTWNSPPPPFRARWQRPLAYATEPLRVQTPDHTQATLFPSRVHILVLSKDRKSLWVNAGSLIVTSCPWNSPVMYFVGWNDWRDQETSPPLVSSLVCLFIFCLCVCLAVNWPNHRWILKKYPASCGFCWYRVCINIRNTTSGQYFLFKILPMSNRT